MKDQMFKKIVLICKALNKFELMETQALQWEVIPGEDAGFPDDDFIIYRATCGSYVRLVTINNVNYNFYMDDWWGHFDVVQKTLNENYII